MIQLSSFMWLLAMFCAFIGFLRGWQREVVVTAGVLVVLFALLQFDPYLRGLLLFTLPRDQIFLIQLRCSSRPRCFCTNPRPGPRAGARRRGRRPIRSAGGLHQRLPDWWDAVVLHGH